MAVNTEAKQPDPIDLVPERYVKVGEVQIPTTKREGHAEIYLNIKGVLKPNPVGSLRVKARRRRNNDDTSYQSYTVCRKKEGPRFEHLITLPWFGNVVPGEWFDYYVKIQDYIVSAKANITGQDHATAMSNGS
jgi:hypothetical protein